MTNIKNNILMNISYHILIVLCVVIQTLCWEYNCNRTTGLCERFSGVSNCDFKSSQNVCKLTCGKFGPLWPAPTISTELGTTVTYTKGVEFYLNGQQGSIQLFEDFAKIFIENIESECAYIKVSYDVPHKCIKNTIQTSIMVVDVSVNNLDTDLKPDLDESYTLNITSNSAIVNVFIKAETLFGARHGLETLSQLITSFPLEKGVCAYVIIANALIEDKPIYKYRGLLIDSARNFLPVEMIKKHIIGLASTKMNVLHWHATDSQSFPVVFKTVPQMAEYGAYNNKSTYSMEDIKDVIDFGKKRGVRIIFELDTPAHTALGWQWGPEAGLGNLILCYKQMPWRDFCQQPPCGQLNPANPNAFNVLKNMYKELLEVIHHQEYFHMGGAHVRISCWNSSEEIYSYMRNKGWGTSDEDFYKLWSDCQQNSLNAYDSLIGNKKSRIILWSSELTDQIQSEQYLSKDRYLIEAHGGGEDAVQTLLQRGYTLIIAPSEAWSLGDGFSASTRYYPWQEVYEHRISRDKMVLGGEAVLWGKGSDRNSTENKIWPRAAAVGERLWSDPDLNGAEVEFRFYRHRDRLISKKIAADSLESRWCFENEGQCL